MFRSALIKVTALLRGSNATSSNRFPQLITASYSHGPPQNHKELVEHYECFFDRWEIDGWEVRQGMTELSGMDLVPDIKLIEAGLHACRRVNDLALAVRWLEVVKDRCGDRVSTIYPYVIKSIRPVLEELGVPTPEELGYDSPELALKSVYSDLL